MAETKYRRDIDGLRALAVLPVIFFHANFNIFSGGYVGVDIFFVISGYLITSILLIEIKENRFSISSFYLRRARRILPALFCVIIACIPFAWLWLLPGDMKDFSQSAIATVAFVSNFFFWLKTGYFDIEAEFKPLLHTWSLAVEEQYYLFFPFLLYVLLKLQNKFVVSLLIVIVLISLLIAQWGSSHSPTANFFLFPSRLWELLLGAITAIYLTRNSSSYKSNKLINEFLSLLGLIFISMAIFGLNKNTPYPSIYTLLPTIGTVLIIVFSNNEVLVGKLLSNELIVRIGVISYSAYLWHQPLFAFARYRTLGELKPITTLTLIGITLVLAYITWRLIENPFRRTIKTKSFSLICVCLVAAILIAGIFGHTTNGFSHDRKISGLPDNYLENALVARKINQGIDGKLCISNFASLCQVTSFDSENPSILMIGDSHSADFTNQFRNYAIKNKLNAWQMSITGCAFLFSQTVNNPDCGKAKSLVLEKAKNHEFNEIIIIGNYYFHTLIRPEESRSLDIQSLTSFIDDLLKSGITVTFFIPRINFNYSPIRVATLNKLEQLKIEKNSTNELDWMAELEKLKQHENFHVFDQNRILFTLGCGLIECFNGHSQNMIPLYRDSSHLTEIGSNMLFDEYISNRLNVR